jgi:predicted transcriptional regulator
MSGFDKSELEELQSRVRPLIQFLIDEKGLTISKVAILLGISYSLCHKLEAGTHFPARKKTKKIVEKLENASKKSIAELKEEIAELEKLTKAEDLKNNYETKKYVSIFLDFKEKTITYKGRKTVGEYIGIKGKPAIIAYASNSEEADGEIVAQDESMSPSIKRGSLIVIKKIDKIINDFRPGFAYCIIDNRYQVHLRKLFVENDTTVRLEAQKETGLPNFTLTLDQIFAIFRIVKAVNYNP